jgi:hypothetical protein
MDRIIVAYLDGLQAKVNALRELQSARGDASQVAPVFWADVDVEHFG